MDLASTLAKFCLCLALGCIEGSGVLHAMGARVCVDDIAPLFCDRAPSPSTLRRHISGWKRWISFCAMVEWSAACPSLTQLVDFMKSLSEGVRADRGSGRARSASGILAAMKFVAFKLQFVRATHLAFQPAGTCLVAPGHVGQPTCKRGGSSTAVGGPQPRTRRCR